MKILVIGGAGFIGSYIVDILLKNNHELYIIDNLSTGKLTNINPKARFYEIDIKDHEKIKEVFSNIKPEVVYHLAAQIDVRKSVESPVEDAKTNILATLNILDSCVNEKIKHFIFSSTGGAIYGDTKILPTPEEHKESPISPYGCAKLSVEKYLKFYNEVHKLKYTCLRYSNVYGPRQNPKGEAGVISIFFENMLNNKPPKIFGGIQTRDYVFVEDVARANLLALNDNKSDTYNIGTGVETDVIELFSKINKYFKDKFEPEYFDMKKGEQKKSCLSSLKIKHNLSWIPETTLSEGLDKTYAWFVKNQEK